MALNFSSVALRAALKGQISIVTEAANVDWWHSNLLKEFLRWSVSVAVPAQRILACTVRVQCGSVAVLSTGGGRLLNMSYDSNFLRCVPREWHQANAALTVWCDKQVFATQQITFVSSCNTIVGKFKQQGYIAKLTQQSGQQTGKLGIYSIM